MMYNIVRISGKNYEQHESHTHKNKIYLRSFNIFKIYAFHTPLLIEVDYSSTPAGRRN